MSRVISRAGLRGYTTSAKTFSNQAILPRLPIPELELTSARYKRSLLPLLSAAEHQQASQKIDRFFAKDGLASTLQQRLHALDDQETALGLNWLDRLWLKKGYLEYRIPTLINVNWWNQFRDPVSGLGKGAPEGQVSDFQLKRSAGMIAGLIDYSNRVNNEEIPPDMSRSGPFCMHQLKNMFGTSRIAAPECDKVVTQWPCLNKHINVIYKDQIFSVQVIGPNGETVPIKTLEEQLRQVVQQVEDTPVEKRQPAVGLLTTEHRDTWGPIRESMEKQTLNAQSLKNIDDSIFVFCLDDYSSPLDLDLSHRNIFHGRNGRNRWFDKALQFIVENNGRAGINGEHSPADAVIPSRIVEDVLTREPIVDSMSAAAISNLEKPKVLQWQVSHELGNAIRTAEKNASTLISDLDSVLLHYGGYGSNMMKEAKVSPDGWLQMVYQLAYYRHYGKSCPTYESASTRKFRAGRTETVRTCSTDTVAFTKAWEDKDIKMADKLGLFEKAIGSHMEYMKAASNGHGVDRHLLGLRCQMTPEETASEDAAIYRDPSYWGSQYWLLSTSNTSPGDLAWGGFGAVVPEGYGINYAIGKERVRMSVSSWNSYKDTDSASFRKTIHGVLEEFGDVAQRYLIKK
ncbi:acyltransferase ChoActase/COT/CPT [Mucor mucedo]|uniref:acyltransferase ChoActase/COT/CPT n=1 Tax=Mucor mucedo TaxID=29922 RepID=UPI00221FEEC3|nr:acyltransferase ChoActase/COT/CPT [Mucor mucedo]KAI7890266.1 acyltransferase ChoActase/COT/CPT [Mucor mucedo]